MGTKTKPKIYKEYKGSLYTKGLYEGTLREIRPMKIHSEKLCTRDFILTVKESKYPQHMLYEKCK